MPSTEDGRRRRRTGHRARPSGFAEGGRQWNEVLSSAAVILAGVLVVIGFGFVAVRGLKGNDEPAPPIDPPAPALGDLRLPPPTGSSNGQGLIPLGSASPSPPPSPTKVATVPPPSRDQLRLAQDPVPSLVNLSAEGESDWVHWGLDGTFSLERDKKGEFRILEGAPTAPRFQHTLSPQKFKWTGGDPVAASDGTTTGIRTCGQGNGFTLTAPAGPTPRVLKLYVGVFAARGKLTARLSTGESTGTTVLDQRGDTLRTAVLTVAYQAPRSGQVRLSWTTDAAYGKGCSGVALEAATLS
ncbi:hypothetical protein M1L60_12570 [Actinoplanes sp. TRM 88003]|uniref:Uncharacterized protein n=1 Tax=Paractinoplanes aksuensis TaxID=2939490 RepID=A0ABT1DKS5_9ACTN|nr:hypothetical protein [Actinoplanes aksuensis]MCO8271430.1 hypothetical protein [Actinoplanes aksuensis]